MTDCNPGGESLEQYAGKVIPDPWDDPEQDDWPTNEEVKDGLGEDEGGS